MAQLAIDTEISFEVGGVPAPQGSKTAMVTKSGRKLYLDGTSKVGRQKIASWRQAVTELAREEAERLPAPLDGPLSLTVTFRFAMPASRPKWQRVAKISWHTTRPDLTKILRSTEDALKAGGLIADDARIAHLSAVKYEVVGWTGARITLRPLTLFVDDPYRGQAAADRVQA